MIASTVRQARELLEMIQFQHALFALPFALAAMLLAADGVPPARTVALIVACMVTARTAAMTWNRIADRRFDAENPRTSQRALPAGRVTLAGAWTLLLISAASFLVAATLINVATALLAPVALAIVLAYSLAKRVTPATHFVLGLCLAIAPAGAWIAVRGRLDVEALPLVAAVATWTAGFDLLYACQDADFDRRAGLHSLPARIGVAGALRVARGCHVATVLSLAVFAVSVGSPPLGLSAAGAAAVMASAHVLVSPDDLGRVGFAFFQANVMVGFVVLAGAAWEVFAG